MINLAVFASCTGTNFDAIVKAIDDGKLDAKVVLMVCDKSNAKVIDKALKANIDTYVFDPKAFSSKMEYDNCIKLECQKRNVDLICLAGYMRIVSNVLLDAYPNRIINIHPSLLPAFKGKDAIKQAYMYGVKVMGVSIHYVNEDLDGGSIIAQKAFELNDMSFEQAESRIHEIEHELYPNTIKKIIEEDLSLIHI